MFMLSILFCIKKKQNITKQNKNREYLNSKLQIDDFNMYRSTSPQLSRAGNKTETEYVKRNKEEKSKSLINNSTRLTQLSPQNLKKYGKFRDFKNHKTSHHRINTKKQKRISIPQKFIAF